MGTCGTNFQIAFIQAPFYSICEIILYQSVCKQTHKNTPDYGVIYVAILYLVIYLFHIQICIIY